MDGKINNFSLPDSEKENKWIISQLRKRLYLYEDESTPTDKAILEACKGSMMMAFLKFDWALKELKSQFSLFDDILKLIKRREK